MTDAATDPKAPRFAIFRARDAADYGESETMSPAPLGPVETEGSARAVAAGMLDGSTVRLLFAAPGFSLTYAWFKSGYPLPRHSHDADCLYYIAGGSLRIGTEELGRGDGFFVGSDVPYTYVPGPEGVEVLEFRTADRFGIKLLANNPAFWEKAVQTVESQRESWARETASPSGGLPA